MRGTYQTDLGAMLYTQGIYEESSTKKMPLGTIRQLADGRRFVYCKATAAALGAGIAVSKAVAAQALTVAAADAIQNIAGEKKCYFTLTGTPTLNQYEDGILILTADAGVGEMYKVAGNSADDDPDTGRFTVQLYDALKAAMTSSTTGSIFENPHSSVLINPAVANGDATTAEDIIGVTVRPVTASYYFWAQTWGYASVYVTASTAGDEADERVLVPSSTAGHFLCIAAGAENDQVNYGRLVVGADYTTATPGLVFLTIK
jgi:hypothetical protein